MKNKKIIPLIELSTIIFAICIQVAALLLLLFGGTYCFGERTSVLNIIQFIFGILKTTKANAVANVTKLVIAVVYIIYAIAFVKRFLSALKHLSMCKKTVELRSSLWRATINDSSYTFINYLLFCFLCNLMSKNALEWYTIAFLVIAGAFAVFSHVYNAFNKELIFMDKNKRKFDYSYFIQSIVQIALLLGIFICFLFLSYQSWGNMIIVDGKRATVTPKMGSNIIYYVYVYLLNDGLTFISVLSFCSLIKNTIQITEATGTLYVLRKKAKGIMIFNIILLAFNCIVRSFFVTEEIDVDISVDLVKNWLQLTRSYYLPVMLLSIGQYVVFSVQKTRTGIKENNHVISNNEPVKEEIVSKASEELSNVSSDNLETAVNNGTEYTE